MLSHQGANGSRGILDPTQCLGLLSHETRVPKGAAGIRINCSLHVTLLKGREDCKASVLSFGIFRECLCYKGTSHAFFLGGGSWGIGLSGERLAELIAVTMKEVRLRAAYGPERSNISSEATHKARSAELGHKPASAPTPEPRVCLLTCSRGGLRSKFSVCDP